MQVQVYGIDLAKDKFDVNWIDPSGEEHNHQCNNNIEEISGFLQELDSDSVICAEYTGCYGDLLVRLCGLYEVRIALVPGYELKHSTGMAKGKNDTLDARRIREYAEFRYRRLRYVESPSEHVHELREMQTMRKKLVDTRKRFETAEMGRDHLVMRSMAVARCVQETLDNLARQITAIEKEIEQLIQTAIPLKKNYDLLISVNGIGPVIASELIIKTGNFMRIDTAKKAASFAGVCPFPNRSGKMVAKNKVSHLADKRLKSLLFLGTRSAVRYNKDFKHYFERKQAEGKAYHLIMNNLSNKLLRVAYSVVQNQKEYNPNYLSDDPRLSQAS